MAVSQASAPCCHCLVILTPAQATHPLPDTAPCLLMAPSHHPAEHAMSTGFLGRFPWRSHLPTFVQYPWQQVQGRCAGMSGWETLGTSQLFIKAVRQTDWNLGSGGEHVPFHLPYSQSLLSISPTAQLHACPLFLFHPYFSSHFTHLAYVFPSTFIFPPLPQMVCISRSRQ